MIKMPVVMPKIFAHICQHNNAEKSLKKNKFKQSLAAELWSGTLDQFHILGAEGSHISIWLQRSSGQLPFPQNVHTANQSACNPVTLVKKNASLFISVQR